jgi:hypothetical protein
MGGESLRVPMGKGSRFTSCWICCYWSHTQEQTGIPFQIAEFKIFSYKSELTNILETVLFKD